MDFLIKRKVIMTINAIETRLDRIEQKLDDLIRNGCSKAAIHEDSHKRIRIVENQISEGKGKLAILMLIIGALCSFGLQWLGKHLP